MPDKKAKKSKASQTIPVSLRKEMAQPRIAKSARKAELNLNAKGIHSTTDRAVRVR
jgi:hypothetical protein